MARIVRHKSGSVTITAWPRQAMAATQPQQSLSRARHLPRECQSLHRPKPVLIRTVIVSCERRRLVLPVRLLLVEHELNWPTSTNGTPYLGQMETIATRRYGLSIITVCGWPRQQHRTHPPLLQVFQSRTRRKLVLLPIVRDGWKPRMVIRAGLSQMGMVSMRMCSISSIQYWARAEQIVGHKSGRLTHTVWLLEGETFGKQRNVLELVAKDVYIYRLSSKFL